MTHEDKAKLDLVNDLKLKLVWDDVPSSAREPMGKVLGQYKETVFSHSDTDIGFTGGLVEHKIELVPGGVPIKQRVRYTTHAQEVVVASHVESMLANNIITPVSSEWASPVVLVGKKDGSIRFCIDFRMVNRVTKFDSFPLPNIDETLAKFAGAQYFSSLNLTSGYWQIPVAKDSKEIITFTCHLGTFQWERMPFGLLNAGQTLQRFIEKAMAQLQSYGKNVSALVTHAQFRTIRQSGMLPSIRARLRRPAGQSTYATGPPALTQTGPSPTPALRSKTKTRGDKLRKTQGDQSRPQHQHLSTSSLDDTCSEPDDTCSEPADRACSAIGCLGGCDAQMLNVRSSGVQQRAVIISPGVRQHAISDGSCAPVSTLDVRLSHTPQDADDLTSRAAHGDDASRSTSSGEAARGTGQRVPVPIISKTPARHLNRRECRSDGALFASRQ